MSTSLMKRIKVCTKAEYLAISNPDPDVRYFITDMPENNISNADMALAITSQANLYDIGATYICKDNGTYLQGHIYQLNEDKDEWLDITAGSADIDNITISKNSDDQLQAIAITDGSDTLTYSQLYQALTIRRHS